MQTCGELEMSESSATGTAIGPYSLEQAQTRERAKQDHRTSL